MDSTSERIVHSLLEKTELRAVVFARAVAAFAEMKTVAEAIAGTMSKHFKASGKEIEVGYTDIHDQEFHLQFGRDVLTFSLQTDITGLMEGHILNDSAFVKSGPGRGVFASFLVYNFLDDAIKYNRFEEFGILLARLLLNGDGHFYIEGPRELNLAYPDIEDNVLDGEVMRAFVEGCMLSAISQDLIAPNFMDIQVITLESKLAAQVMRSGTKVGFRSKSQQG